MEAEYVKELLQTKICAVERLTEERFTAYKTALQIQTRELERRLDALNGEAERLRLMQITYLPREVYDYQHAMLSKKVEFLEKIANQTAGKGQGMSTLWMIVSFVLVLSVAIAGILIR